MRFTTEASFPVKMTAITFTGKIGLDTISELNQYIAVTICA